MAGTSPPSLALTAAAAVLVAGCGALVPDPVRVVDPGIAITEVDTEPRRVELPPHAPPAGGPVVEVARLVVDGSPIRMTAYRDTNGMACLGTEGQNGGGMGCGSLPGAGPSDHELFGMTGTGGGVFDEHSGLVRGDVAAVMIETSAGHVETLLVSLEPADIDASAFLGFVPPDVDVLSFVALGSDGAVLERFAMPNVPAPDGGGVPPTPATP